MKWVRKGGGEIRIEGEKETRGSGFLDAFELVADTYVTTSLFKYERNSFLAVHMLSTSHLRKMFEECSIEWYSIINLVSA